MSEMLETCMLVCFGMSWPISVIKSYNARTAKGKSVFFVIIIMIGYLFGIGSKIASGNINYVLLLYILNLAMVFVDFCLYFRNRRIDKNEEEILEYYIS